MGIARCFRREIGRLYANKALLIATFGVPLFSAIFLATLFGNGEMADIPIGVIDNDFSHTSRSIIQTIDASAELSVAHRFDSPEEALDAIRRGEIFGLVVVPRGSGEDIASGRACTLPYYFHYAYLSIGATVESTLNTILTSISFTPAISTASALGISRGVVESALTPLNGNVIPLFNPTLSYSTYLSIPFCFIMLQIIVMLTAIYTLGSDIEGRQGKEWLGSGSTIMGALIGKSLPYILIFGTTSMVALWLLREVSSTPFLGPTTNLAFYALLLIVASWSLGLFIYALFPRMSLSISFISMLGSLGATLCGVTFPLASLNSQFRLLAELLPIRHFTLLMEGLSFEERLTHNHPWHLLILILFILLPLLTARRLRRIVTSRQYEKRTLLD